MHTPKTSENSKIRPDAPRKQPGAILDFFLSLQQTHLQPVPNKTPKITPRPTLEFLAFTPKISQVQGVGGCHRLPSPPRASGRNLEFSPAGM
jgi:hypothetical protein